MSTTFQMQSSKCAIWDASFTSRDFVWQSIQTKRVGEGKRKYRGDPFNQTFREFRSKTQWIGSVQPEKFRKNGSTFWGGPLFPVGLACEQALCLGKNSEEREGKGGAFPSPHPARLKACSQATVGPVEILVEWIAPTEVFGLLEPASSPWFVLPFTWTNR